MIIISPIEYTDLNGVVHVQSRINELNNDDKQTSEFAWFS